MPNKLLIAEQVLISKLNYSHTDIGYFKYKSHTPTIVDCIKEYPITEFILEKIKKGDYPNNYLSDAIKGAITRNKVNKESNSWLVDAISSYHQEGEPLDTIILLEQVISSITKNDVSLFANKTFDNKYIQASLMPKK